MGHQAKTRANQGQEQIPPIHWPVTGSLGVTALESDNTIMSLFIRADGALHAAKNAGRNRVVVA
jgi:PleD family two-component response regulator